MANIQIIEEAGRLKIVKDRASEMRTDTILTAAGLVGILLSILSFFTLGGFSIIFLLVSLLVAYIGASGLWRTMTKGNYTVFDRQADAVTQNDKPLAKISDLKGIEVQHYSRHSKQGRAYYDRYLIYLNMPDGSKTEMNNNDDPAIIDQTANRLAAYTGLPIQHTEEIKQESLHHPKIPISKKPCSLRERFGEGLSKKPLPAGEVW